MKDTSSNDIRKMIKQIELNNISGSIELAKESAEIINILGKQTSSLNKIRNTALDLIKAQSAMASIFNFVNNLMFYIDKNKNKEIKKIVQSYCKNFIQDLKILDESISKNTAKLIKNNITIMTHSFSSTVLKALISAKKSGKNFSIICTESRPMNEGITLAKQLGKNGIKVKLIVDSAVFSFLKDTDIILLGGDAVTSKGLINKIGTKGLAITAQKQKIPIYALCSTIKILPEKYIVKFNQEKNTKEIIRNKIFNVTPINYYFDLTPLEYLTGIITENKILKHSEIIEKIEHFKTHNSIIKNPSIFFNNS
jgi:translation initiation factor 2B subunit (eIF-2B alpha/beta/delta family)